MRILAAGLSMCILLRIVAPSLVTVNLPSYGPAPPGVNILSMPLGPNVVLTKSPTAIAPTKLPILAISPFCSYPPSFNTFGNTFYSLYLYNNYPDYIHFLFQIINLTYSNILISKCTNIHITNLYIN